MFKMLTNLFKSPFPSIDIDDYHSDYYKKNNHVLIDVRSPQEFKSGHIPGAKNVPLQGLSNNLKKVPKNKDVIVVCRSGSRSGMACRILTNEGYDNITNVRGGTMAWLRAGHEVKK
jgi:rhodanese-related sulfurtransferase